MTPKSGPPGRPAFRLFTRMLVEQDLDTTFQFFADAGNLQRLTPPWLSFTILTPPPIAMHTGALIDYRISIRGVPLRWRTEITEWAPPFRFADSQVRGPYRLWHHVHAFRAVEGGTLIEDTVHYNPFGGRLVHDLFVKGDLERIFTFRQQELRRIFGGSALEPVTVEIAPVLV